VPMLMFGCGLRIAEAAGLRVEDVDLKERVVRLEDHPMRTLKNASSRRVVPLPDWIVAEGFLDYTRTLPNGPIFPGLKPDFRGNLTGNLVKRWSRIVRTEAKVKDKRIQPAHSARHWYADKLRGAGIEPEIRDRLMGHATPGMGSNYGAGFTMQALREAVDGIRWPW
jgi:integrase